PCASRGAVARTTRRRRKAASGRSRFRPEVVAVLRAAQPLHMTPESFVFTTPTGLPLDTDRFVELRWHRALRATGTRPRKFYATRHTFISVALSSGCKAKWVAKYCGTSLEMLDKHYGRWMDDDRGQLELLTARAPNAGRRGPKPGPKPGPKRIAAASTRSAKRRGGSSNFERTRSAPNPRAVQLRGLLNGTRQSRSREWIPEWPERTRLDPEKRKRFPLPAGLARNARRGT